jgi:hypothetical protein
MRTKITKRNKGRACGMSMKGLWNKGKYENRPIVV